jgi:hypothetical protein
MLRKTLLGLGVAVSLALAPFSQADSHGDKPATKPSIKVGTYLQQIHNAYTIDHGLPTSDVLSIAIGGDSRVYAGTASGLAVYNDGAWTVVDGATDDAVATVTAGGDGVLFTYRSALFTAGAQGAKRLAALPTNQSRPEQLHALAYAPSVSLAGGGSTTEILLGTERGLFQLKGDHFEQVRYPGDNSPVRQIAVGPDKQIAVAAKAGLYTLDGGGRWTEVEPSDGTRSWAARDVRGVAYDSEGRLWFGTPQGAGQQARGWTLYTGYDGLPYDDFTVLAAGTNGDMWMGTKIGAVRNDNGNWEYRQGRRWLLADEVRDIAVDGDNGAWFATENGVSNIALIPMTLAEKARRFEEQIDQYHRRTEYEYVLSTILKEPGDLSTSTQRDSDNDGLWTCMYGVGEAYAYAATKDPKAKERATKAFRAIAFLSEVTQGGANPAPEGFPARTVLPAGGSHPNPNDGRIERDKRSAQRDELWKVYEPRWPLSADRKYYWKGDTSSDELDGHFWFYSVYYDLVAETEEEKAEAREVTRRVIDHMLAHNYNLVDNSGTKTRWGRFSPEDLNQNKQWWVERGLNSLSMLAYLKAAEHVTGDSKYADAAKELRDKHAYHTNSWYSKFQKGAGSGNQSDDEMGFMGYYSLLKYEEDAYLREIYAGGFFHYWSIMEPELNPLFNFMYAAQNTGETYKGAFPRENLDPYGTWLEDSVDSLKRFPLDGVRWSMKNSHRKDIVRLPKYALDSPDDVVGHRRNGYVLPIDERDVEHWNHNPWDLDYNSGGRLLRDQQSYLIAYYMGLYYGYIEE